MAEKVGVFDRLFISADDSTHYELEFLEGSSLGPQEQFVEANGLRGSRQHRAERVRRTQRMVQGRLNFAPNAAELDLLLLWILGTDKATNTFAVAETVPGRYLRATRDGSTDAYTGVKVNRATFSCSEGGILQCSLDVIGVDESSGSSVPTATLDNTDAPYVMADCVLSIGGTEYPFRSWQLTIDNALEVRYNNSPTPTSIHATDLNVQVQLQLPLGDAGAAYGTAVSGVAVVATFTQGAKFVRFTASGVSAPKQAKDFGTRQALNFPWVGTARKTGSTSCISVDNDSTGA